MSKKTIISVEQDINLMVKVPVKGKKERKKNSTHSIEDSTKRKRKEKTVTISNFYDITMCKYTSKCITIWYGKISVQLSFSYC